MPADRVGIFDVVGGNRLVRRPFSRLEVGGTKPPSRFFDSWGRLMGLNPTGFQIDRVELDVGKELAFDLLTQMVNILFHLVDGSNVISNLQAQLYGFHSIVSSGLAGGLVEP